MDSQKIRIRLKAFDYKLIDQSAQEIVDQQKEPAPWLRAQFHYLQEKKDLIY